MKISKLTELLFSQAVVLSQSGKLRNTIHAKGKELFVLNFDNTILIKFDSPDDFLGDFSFFANDYESDTFDIRNGKIVFTSGSNNLKREKTCSIPKISFSEVKEKWDLFYNKIDRNYFLSIPKTAIDLLEDDLSHVEFHDVSDIKLVQKDIYSGASIVIKNSLDGFSFSDNNFPKESFPIGLRTVDLKALFSFVDVLNFYFQKDGNFIYFEDNQNRLSGFISVCLYDEIGYLAGADGVN